MDFFFKAIVSAFRQIDLTTVWFNCGTLQMMARVSKVSSRRFNWGSLFVVCPHVVSALIRIPRLLSSKAGERIDCQSLIDKLSLSSLTFSTAGLQSITIVRLLGWRSAQIYLLISFARASVCVFRKHYGLIYWLTFYCCYWNTNTHAHTLTHTWTLPTAGQENSLLQGPQGQNINQNVKCWNHLFQMFTSFHIISIKPHAQLLPRVKRDVFISIHTIQNVAFVIFQCSKNYAILM